MDLNLRNAVVLITGASRGLGREFAIAFADEGARVAICARDPNKLEETAAAVRAHGAECLALQADLLDGAACQLYTGAPGTELRAIGPSLDLTMFMTAIYFGERSP